MPFFKQAGDVVRGVKMGELFFSQKLQACFGHTKEESRHLRAVRFQPKKKVHAKRPANPGCCFKKRRLLPCRVTVAGQKELIWARDFESTPYLVWVLRGRAKGNPTMLIYFGKLPKAKTSNTPIWPV